MIKWVTRFGVIGLAVSLLVACQSFDAARIKQIKETEQSQANALIFCQGTHICEFERIDRIQIVDEQAKRVSKEAIQHKVVRLNGYSISSPQALYLSVPAAQHEVAIRFYPISKEKAEKLIIIHDFKKNQRYVFQMYRHRAVSGGSLLKVSAPEPLCVDLKEGQKLIRRFCKPYDAQNGLGEFVEQKLTLNKHS